MSKMHVILTNIFNRSCYSHTHLGRILEGNFVCRSRLAIYELAKIHFFALLYFGEICFCSLARSSNLVIQWTQYVRHRQNTHILSCAKATIRKEQLLGLILKLLLVRSCNLIMHIMVPHCMT